MYLLILGLIFLALKISNLMPVSGWPWWVVLTPLGLTVVWWTVADLTGYTNKQVAKRLEAKRQARIIETREDLGALSKKNRL